MISFIQIAAAVFAIILVMILHELPKAIVYNMSKGNKDSISDIFHIIRYVDPIGVIFCIATGAGFSKPYRYKIESKKQALAIGITGFGSLLLQFLVCMILYKKCYTGATMEVFI